MLIVKLLNVGSVQSPGPHCELIDLGMETIVNYQHRVNRLKKSVLEERATILYQIQTKPKKRDT